VTVIAPSKSERNTRVSPSYLLRLIPNITLNAKILTKSSHSCITAIAKANTEIPLHIFIPFFSFSCGSESVFKNPMSTDPIVTLLPFKTKHMRSANIDLFQSFFSFSLHFLYISTTLSPVQFCTHSLHLPSPCQSVIQDHSLIRTEKVLLCPSHLPISIATAPALSSPVFTTQQQ
jgi:hypothetical protein